MSSLQFNWFRLNLISISVDNFIIKKLPNLLTGGQVRCTVSEYHLLHELYNVFSYIVGSWWDTWELVIWILFLIPVV